MLAGWPDEGRGRGRGRASLSEGEVPLAASSSRPLMNALHSLFPVAHAAGPRPIHLATGAVPCKEKPKAKLGSQVLVKCALVKPSSRSVTPHNDAPCFFFFKEIP